MTDLIRSIESLPTLDRSRLHPAAGPRLEQLDCDMADIVQEDGEPDADGDFGSWQAAEDFCGFEPLQVVAKKEIHGTWGYVLFGLHPDDDEPALLVLSIDGKTGVLSETPWLGRRGNLTLGNYPPADFLAAAILLGWG